MISCLGVLGTGNAGAQLAHAAERAGLRCERWSARQGGPADPFDGDLLLLAVRDPEIAPWAQRLAEGSLVTTRCAVAHLAGARGPEELAVLRPLCAGVAQMHPLLSFASREHPVTLRGGFLHVAGDAAALARIDALAQRLELRVHKGPLSSLAAYHAGAGFLANGAAALAGGALELFSLAGIPPVEARPMLASLLRSVAENLDSLGSPAALTGPVRRGDAHAVARQLALQEALAPARLPLLRASISEQLAQALALAEAPESSFHAIRELLERTSFSSVAQGLPGPSSPVEPPPSVVAPAHEVFSASMATAEALSTPSSMDPSLSASPSRS